MTCNHMIHQSLKDKSCEEKLAISNMECFHDVAIVA